jgi:hypothetical protein
MAATGQRGRSDDGPGIVTRFRAGVVAALVAMPGACTYAPPQPTVRVANHVYRAGTDSVALAVYAAQLRQPTGLAAFPDGGSPRVDREQAIFYLCVASPNASTKAVLTRVTVVPRPDSLRSGFTPWLSAWDGPGQLVASLRGYTTRETRADALRTVWLRISLTGRVETLAAGPPVLGPATSLPIGCEVAALADARVVLAADARRGD